MNIERLEILAELLEERPQYKGMGFNMLWISTPTSISNEYADGYADCDTVGCIAGWGCMAFGAGRASSSRYAAELLGLGPHEAICLFYPGSHLELSMRLFDSVLDVNDYSKIDRKMAAQAVRNLVAIERQRLAALEPMAEPPPELLPALGVKALAVAKNAFDYLVEVESEEILRAMSPDHSTLRRVPVRGVIATSVAMEPVAIEAPVEELVGV